MLGKHYKMCQVDHLFMLFSPDVDVSLMNYALSAATTYICGPSWHGSQDQHVIMDHKK